MTKYDYSVAVTIACKTLGLPIPEAEYKFLPDRKFRFDFAFVEQKVALECEGGTYIAGRHSRGEADHEKYNLAAADGWRIFRTIPRKVGNLDIYRLIQRLVK